MSALPIIDTDILVDVARQVGDAISYLADVEADGVPQISAITEMELIIGCGNNAELRQTEEFLRRFQVLPLDELISDTAVDLLRMYRLSLGLAMPVALIAARAIASGRPLVSKNQRDYRFISDLDLLPYP